MTAVQAQYRGVENLASEGVMKEIDASQAVVSPNPIPVKGEADDVSIKEGTRPDETVGVDSEIDTASVTNDTKIKGAPKVDSEISTASVTSETKTEGGTVKTDAEVKNAAITAETKINGSVVLENDQISIQNFTDDMITKALASAEGIAKVGTIELGPDAQSGFVEKLNTNLSATVQEIVATDPKLVDENGQHITIPAEIFVSKVLPQDSEYIELNKLITNYIQ